MLCLTESAPFTTQEISITGKGKVCGKLQNFIGPLIQVILADFAGRNVLTSGLVDGHADCIDVIDVIEELQSAKGVNLLQRSFAELLPSEKTAVLVARYEKISSQGKRNDIRQEIEALEETCGHDVHKSQKNRDGLGEE